MAKPSKPAAPPAAPKARPRAKKPAKRRVISRRLAAVFQEFTKPELAALLKIPRQGIHTWLDLPPKHALVIEAATKGRLKKEFLAPAFYPSADGGDAR